ncbi:MAG: hypothetical protein IJL70_01775 [Treponema sp.]|nr:hypothetical protein [Treponema sp.]
MKLFSRFVILFAGCLCLYSCTGRSQSDKNIAEEGFDFSSPINQKINVFYDGKHEYAEYGSAFEPDYRPLVPENEPVAKKMSTVFARAKSNKVVLSDAVRELSKYSVKYNTKRISIKDFTNPETSGESSYWEEKLKDQDSFVPEEKEEQPVKKEESEAKFLYASFSQKMIPFDGDRTNVFFIDFSSDPDYDSLIGNITVDKIEVKQKNMELEGRRLKIFDLPLKDYGRNYSVVLNDDIKDKKGREIAWSASRCDIFLPKPASYFKLCDEGNKIMEAQFPHRLVFEFQNLKGKSAWYLKSMCNPLKKIWGSEDYNDNKKILDSKELPSVEDNKPRVQGIDFDEFLDDGYGWISFKAEYDYDDFDYYEKEYRQNHGDSKLNIQVTDLGVTARLGINRVVVLVKKMSTNEPVPDAKVYFYYNSRNSDFDVIKAAENSKSEEFIVSGKTDAKGFAVIPVPEKKAGLIESLAEKEFVPSILVCSGKDKITFCPTDHAWSDGIHEARRVRNRIFMFCDRGLYKPGETVTFRGIDKNLSTGNLSSYEGPYRICLKSGNWSDKTEYGVITGHTAESGGFYGSFDLPENLTPGYYRLCYTRQNGEQPSWGYHQTIYFSVRYFEGAKSTTDIEIPDLNYFGGKRISAKISSVYLAGGVLADAECKVNWFKNSFRFDPETPETKGYVFCPEENKGYRKLISEEKTKLDSSGVVRVACSTEKITDGFPAKYRLEADVTDDSNQRLSAHKDVVVHPAAYYIGLAMPYVNGFCETGKKIDFSYLLVDPEGRKVQPSFVSGKLNYEVKHITWELSSVNGIDDDVYSNYHKVSASVDKGNLKPSEDGIISFTPKKSGEYVLTVSGIDKDGNNVCTDFEFYVTGQDSYWFNRGSSENIDVTFDKKMYNPGDTAKVLLKSSLPKGDYMITVEREGIYTQELRHFNSPCNVIEIPVARNYVPVVYVCVASYSVRTKEPDYEYGEKDMDKPKGYFGQARLMVNPYANAFSIEVNTDKCVYRPGETAKVMLKATKNGRPLSGAELTVMGVDRSVLDLINYHVENPLEFFYNPYSYSHCVTGGDSRDLLMDPVVYAIKNLIGGDASETKDEDIRKDFRPTAFFEPAVTTDSDGNAELTFVVPSQLTTFRVTAIGVRGNLFGIQEDEFGVRNPINVQSVQPRRLRVRDTAECGVLITNLTETDLAVEVAVDIKTPEKDSEEDMEAGLVTLCGDAFIDGESKKSVIVGAGGSAAVYYSVATKKAGTVDLIYTVNSAVLNERLLSKIKIEDSYSMELVSCGGSLDDQKIAASEQQIIIPSWAENDNGSVELTLDSTKLGLLSSAVNYVFDYPYGCTEQRTSKILPLLLFKDHIKVFGMDSKVRSIKSVVKNHFAYLKKIQHNDGGFGYWENSRNSDLYVSLRTAHLYYIAANSGYSASELKINKFSLLNYIIGIDSDAVNSDFVTAYRYYVLSLFFNDDYTRKIQQAYAFASERAYVDTSAIALLGISAAKCKDAGLAAKIFEKLKECVKNTNNPEHLAYALKFAIIMNPKSEFVDDLLMRVLLAKKAGYWANTRATAAVFDSVEDYINARNLDALDLTAKIGIEGTELLKEKFKGAGAQPITQKFSFASEELAALPRDKVLTLGVSKEGTGKLYYSALMRFAIPAELMNFRDNGIYVGYSIIDSETGKELKPSDGNKVVELESGKTYSAKVTLSTKEERQFLALRAPVPSGAEILDAHFETTSSTAEIKTHAEGKSWLKRMSNEALYDNEAQFFWDFYSPGKYELEFQFRAARRGVYPVPPVMAECMYQPEIFGRSDGYLFVIK